MYDQSFSLSVTYLVISILYTKYIYLSFSFSSQSHNSATSPFDSFTLSLLIFLPFTPFLSHCCMTFSRNISNTFTIHFDIFPLSRPSFLIVSLLSSTIFSSLSFFLPLSPTTVFSLHSSIPFSLSPSLLCTLYSFLSMSSHVFVCSLRPPLHLPLPSSLLFSAHLPLPFLSTPLLPPSSFVYRVKKCFNFHALFFML